MPRQGKAPNRRSQAHLVLLCTGGVPLPTGASLRSLVRGNTHAGFWSRGRQSDLSIDCNWSCCAGGCVRIGASHKRNSRCTWGSLSSCTTCESEGKRCFLRSLSCWSRKTLESNKSVQGFCIRWISSTPMSSSAGIISGHCMIRPTPSACSFLYHTQDPSPRHDCESTSRAQIRRDQQNERPEGPPRHPPCLSHAGEGGPSSTEESL